MNKVIVLYSSPVNKDISISTYLTKKFVEQYKLHNKNDEIIEFDLNDLDLNQQYQNSNNMSDFFKNELNDKYINLLKEANKLIIGAPMINFNIPVTLKNFIDHIAIANKTFSYKYSKKGDAIGLLNNLDVQIIATQGAPLDWYPFASHYKFLEGFWNFVGANVKESIIIHSVKIAENIEKTKEEFYEENKALIELKAKEL